MKKLLAISSVVALCSVGFMSNAQASRSNGGRFLNKMHQVHSESLNYMSQRMIRTEETTEEAIEDTPIEQTTFYPCSYGHENCDGIHAVETTSNPCAYGHENCNGVHASEDCVYYEEGETGVRMHHNQRSGNGMGAGNGHHRGNHHN